MYICVQTGDPEAAHCKAVVAVEMLSLMGNRIWDFPDCPSLNDVSHTPIQNTYRTLVLMMYIVIYTCTQAFELVCGCQWSDVLLELELLTRIARPALLQSNYKLVPGTSVLCTWYLRTLYLVPPYSVPPYSVPGTSILCT